MSTVIPSKHIFRASQHEWAWEMFQQHEELHWLPEEVPMMDDIRDWKERATEDQKQFIKNIMLFFTQADIEVCNTYIDEYLPQYRNELPIKTMLTSFAGREGIHTKAYAYIVESLALGDATFSEFLNDPVLLKIHSIMNKYKTNRGLKERFQAMCATSLLGEGVMLFGLFAKLLNFQRHNLFNGTCTIVAWSIRDEDLHVAGIAKLIKTDVAFAEIDTATKARWFWEVHAELAPLVKEFTTNCFDGKVIPGITLEETLKFIDFQVARRVRQANIQEDFELPANPFPWFDQIVGGVEDANFFERRRTEYSKHNIVGEWVYD